MTFPVSIQNLIELGKVSLLIKNMFKILVGLFILSFVDAIPTRVMKGKIIGGMDVSIEVVPYQISLFSYDIYRCGGSIISKNYILTAKRCVNQHAVMGYHIRAGSADVNKNGTIHRVVRFITHEQGGLRKKPDIALAEITPPFEFDATHAPIPIFNAKEEIVPNSIAFVTGWGKTSIGVTQERKLLQGVFLPMISKQECNRAYEYRSGISEFEICAVAPNDGKGVCQGDFGGPLVIDGRLAGIVSWGVGCAHKEYPGVYVEVAYFSEWIRKHAEVDTI